MAAPTTAPISATITIETPQWLIDNYPALTLRQAAICCNRLVLTGTHKGEPNELAIRNLIRDGRLELVDETAPAKSWAVTRRSVRKYLRLDEPQQGSAA